MLHLRMALVPATNFVSRVLPVVMLIGAQFAVAAAAAGGRELQIHSPASQRPLATASK